MIDTHVHFWRYEAKGYPWIDDGMLELRCDFLPEHLRPVASAAGVTSVIAVQARQSLDETRFLLELADEHSLIAGVIGWVDLCAATAAADLAELGQHPKFLGVRHLVQDEPDDNFLLRSDFRRGVSLLSKPGLTYDLLIRERHFSAAVGLVEQLPEQLFVLDHVAKPNLRSRALRARERTSRSNVVDWGSTGSRRHDLRLRWTPRSSSGESGAC